MKRLHKYRLFFFTVFAATIVMPCFSQTVFKTPSGQKYHLASCRVVKNVSQEITLSDAVALGLSPCKICKPSINYGADLAPHKAQGQNHTVQCKGLTKSGSRCKHMTSIANGYCYQHQPN